jgi:hypothetical protein
MPSRRPSTSAARSNRAAPERLMDRVSVRAIVLALFAVAMGHVEAVVVYYIRLHLGDLQATGTVPPEVLRSFPWGIEATREVATLVMLGTIAVLAGRNWWDRTAGLLWAFALWDATYYLSLRIMTGWPQSFLSPDVYFLLPVPWGGPVWIPLAADLLILAAAAALVLRGLRSSGSPGVA